MATQIALLERSGVPARRQEGPLYYKSDASLLCPSCSLSPLRSKRKLCSRCQNQDHRDSLLWSLLSSSVVCDPVMGDPHFLVGGINVFWTYPTNQVYVLVEQAFSLRTS